MLSQTTRDSRDVFHTVAGNAASCITAYWLPIAEMGSSARFARCANRSRTGGAVHRERWRHDQSAGELAIASGGDAVGVIARPGEPG